MDTGTGILQAVRDEPDDDLHRLAFADWLLETGRQDWADYVRCAIDLFGDPLLFVNDPRRGLLTAETFRQWFPVPVAESCEVRIIQCQVTDFVELTLPGDAKRWVVGLWRGFLETCLIPQDRWLLHGPALVRRHPLTDVRLSDRRPFRASNGVFSWRVSKTLLMQEHWFLHWRLADFLSGWQRRRDGIHETIYTYRTNKAALADLDRACLLMAREGAGGVTA